MYVDTVGVLRDSPTALNGTKPQVTAPNRIYDEPRTQATTYAARDTKCGHRPPNGLGHHHHQPQASAYELPRRLEAIGTWLRSVVPEWQSVRSGLCQAASYSSEPSPPRSFWMRLVL